MNLSSALNPVPIIRRRERRLAYFPVYSLRNLAFAYFVLRWSRRLYWKLKGRGIVGAILEFYNDLRRLAYGYFLRAPGVREKVQTQVQAALSRISDRFIPPNMARNLVLPEKGISTELILAELQSLADMDHTRWEDGYLSGAVYHAEEDLLKLQVEAYDKFSTANPIHPDAFPGVRKMEAEIVSMVLNMLNAPSSGAGVSTSGGSESILMACLSARQKAYVERGVTEPEM